MKKSLLFGFAALAALAFSACQKEVTVNEKEMVTVTLVAQKAGDETRTAAVEEDNKVSYEWTAEDQSNLKLFVVGVDDKGKETLTLVENPTSSISSDKKTLTVTATVEELSTLRAAISGGWTNDGLKAKVMTDQSPLTNNFDPNADVLVSEDVEVDGLNNALLTFKRPVAINKMTLKQLVAGEKIHEVTITSDKNLIGYYEGGKMNGQSGGNSITISYDNIEVGENGEFPVYFVTMPNEGHSLSVVVKSDQFVYAKTFGPVNFSLGKFSKFGVKLPDGEPVVDTDYTGDWVITGKNGDSYYAAQAYVSGNNNLRALGIKLDVQKKEIASTKVNEIKMSFAKVKSGDYEGLYTIKDASGNYLYAAGTSGSTSNTLKGTTTLGGNDYYWSVEEEIDGTFTIKASKSSNNNIMRFNSSSGVFSCYGSGQNALTLYPYSWVVEEAGIQPSGAGTLEDPYNVTAAVAYTESLGTATSPDYIYIQGIISQIANNGTYGSYGNATFYISDDGTTSSVQFEAYRILYLGNVAWKNGQTNIKLDDKVILCGKVKMYNGVAEISQDGYLYSLNGVTGKEKYTITVNPSENGTVTASATEAVSGAEITLTVNPAEGYELDALTVVDASSNTVAVSNNKFTMPASNVTVSATFKKEDTSATYYVKVTSADNLTDGEYLIVYEEGGVAFNGGLETLDAVGNTIEVIINDSKIAASSTIDAATFTYDASAKSLKSASGLYIGQTSDANGLKSSATDAYENTISFDADGNANIVSSSAYLRFNAASNQTRFRYYKSSGYTGQKAIALYKK